MDSPPPSYPAPQVCLYLLEPGFALSFLCLASLNMSATEHTITLLGNTSEG